MILYTIYDRLAEQIAPLFWAENDEVAKRIYKSLDWSTHAPIEHKLLKLGSIDSKTGIINPLPTPEDIYVEIVDLVALRAATAMPQKMIERENRDG